MARRILDAHCDTVMKIVDHDEDIVAGRDQTHIDAPRLLDGAVGCQIFACFASHADWGDQVRARSDRLLEAVQALVGQGPFVAPSSAAELEALAARDDTVGILLAIEGGEALGGEPERVAELAALGVRYITIAWGDNELCGASLGEGYGLTDLGRQVVAAMESHRVLVDVSHMSDQAFADLQQVATRPFIASHSNCRALCRSPRNLTDDQIRAVADSGGVIGVNFVAAFLTDQAFEAQQSLFEQHLPQLTARPEARAEIMARLEQAITQTPKPPLAAIADHVDHLVKVGGIESVAFGSDFDGFPHGPAGLTGCHQYPQIVELLRARGYAETDLDRICWDNWVRVLSTTFA